MCKHILNAQVSVRAPCCKRWFDCPDCHTEASDHKLLKVHEIVMACKKCKKVFRKDSRLNTDESDEYCPHCDNHYVIKAVLQPSAEDFLVSELLQQQQQSQPQSQQLLFNDPRMKPKYLDFDEEFEALLN